MMITKLRTLLWRILGVDYKRFLRTIDFTFLRNDAYTSIGFKSYDNGATVSRAGKSKITIGKYCSIAQFVRFFADGGNHKFSHVANFPLFDSLFDHTETIAGHRKQDFRNQFTEKEGITIGNDVWIGMGCYIMPGVTVGNGVTIAANSVVTKSIADYAVVAGTPATLVKMKYDDDTIQKLNAISWWNWDEALIKSRINDFYFFSAKDFVDKYYDPAK